MKRYNPNTAYGRRKNRDTAQQRINNYSKEEKSKYNGCMAIVYILIIIIAFIVIVLKKL